MQLMLDFVIVVVRPVSEMLISVHINTWNIKLASTGEVVFGLIYR